MGKSDAMKRAIEGAETPSSFPAVGLRGVATWVLDQAAASKLSSEYAR
jgi:6-phosphogluconolactonase